MLLFVRSFSFVKPWEHFEEALEKNAQVWHVICSLYSQESYSGAVNLILLGLHAWYGTFSRMPVLVKYKERTMDYHYILFLLLACSKLINKLIQKSTPNKQEWIHSYFQLLTIQHDWIRMSSTEHLTYWGELINVYCASSLLCKESPALQEEGK